MLEFIKKKAIDFIRVYPQNCSNLAFASRQLEEALRGFALNKSKLEFLALLRIEMEKHKESILNKPTNLKKDCRLIMKLLFLRLTRR